MRSLVIVTGAMTRSNFFASSPGSTLVHGQVEIGDLDAELLGDGVDQVAVDALVDAVVGDIEGRKLHFRRDDELAALLDVGERVGSCGPEASRQARRREPGQDSS